MLAAIRTAAASCTGRDGITPAGTDRSTTRTHRRGVSGRRTTRTTAGDSASAGAPARVRCRSDSDSADLHSAAGGVQLATGPTILRIVLRTIPAIDRRTIQVIGHQAIPAIARR